MYRRYDNNVYGSWTIDYAMNLAMPLMFQMALDGWKFDDCSGQVFVVVVFGGYSIYSLPNTAVSCLSRHVIEADTVDE